MRSKSVVMGASLALLLSVSAPVLAQSGEKTKGEEPPPVVVTAPSETDATKSKDDAPPPLPDGEAGETQTVEPSEAGQAMKDYLMEVNALTLTTLRDRFPADLDPLEDRLDGLLEGIEGEFDREAALEGFADVIAEQRIRYAAQAASAPDEALRAIVAGLAEFTQAVYDREGPAVCGEFSNVGSSVLYGNDVAENYVAELDRQSSLFLTAAADARDNPVTRAAVSDPDLVAVFDKMIADGGTEEQIDVLASQDPTNPETCPALIAMLNALATLDGPQGERSRAYFVPEFSGY